MKNAFLFLWKMIKPYKWQYFTMMLAPILTSFYPFLYNYSVKLLLDVLTETKSFLYTDLSYPIILFISTQVLISLAWRINNVLEWKIEPKVRKNIVTASYDYVQNHSYKFFLNNFPANVTSKLKGILDGYDTLWEQFHHGISISLLSNIINMIVLFTVSYQIGVFMLLWGIAFFFVFYFMSKKINLYSFEETQARHRLVGTLADKITNIASLFSFATRKVELKDLEKNISKDFMPRQIALYRYDFVIQLVASIFYLIMFISILFMMIEARRQNLVSIGDFVFVFGIVFAISNDLMSLISKLQVFVQFVGDFTSAFEFLNTPHELKDKPNAKNIQITKGEITIENMSFSYDSNKQMFQDINIKIKPGEKIGIVGHSGAGKSTLVNILLKYFHISSGSVKIDGQNIAYVKADSIREKIAVIPQDNMLFHKTVMENIRYGNSVATDHDVIKVSKEAHIHEDIENLPQGYNTIVGDKGFKLSGGQRQRIAIARAILKDAPILVLDEATSSLDSQTEKKIQDSLNILIEDKKTTVVAIAHRLSTLKNMDRILVLDQGQIAEEGSHTELLSKKNSLYNQLWKLQKI
jgi:ATP-binding cassette subfamily B protein